MNYIDLVILLILVLFGIYGYFRGFIRIFFSLLFFALSLFLAFVLNNKISSLFGSFIRVPPNILKVFSFLLLWAFFEFIFTIVYSYIDKKIPQKTKELSVNKFFGIFPSVMRGIFVIAVILMLLVVLPTSPSFKDKVLSSKLGRPLVSLMSKIEKRVDSLFRDGISETITLLTIRPESEESAELGFKTSNLNIDELSERKMFDLVNEERINRDLKPLIFDAELQKVARAHSKDMFENGYFAHDNLQGETPFDRMEKAGIKFLVAGENLALAQSVDLAHQGLMDSPGHRANILNAEFGKISIGVYDGGVYGKMFTQEFTD